MKMPKIQESLRIFTLMDVPVYFHFTSVVMLMMFFQLGVLIGLCMYTSLLLHEFGHVYVARRFGIPTTKVVVMIFGMVAFMNIESLSMARRAIVAVAGPLVNVLIGCTLFVAMLAIPMSASVMSTVGILASANFLFAAFNMLPIQPLDGSHILRWILHRFFNEYSLKKVMTYTSLYAAAIFCFFSAKLEMYFTAVIMGIIVCWMLFEVSSTTDTSNDEENNEDDEDK